MKPPQSFYDFTLQLHQDLDLVYPAWDSDRPDGRHEIYEDFRQVYGDQAVRELAKYGKELLSDQCSKAESSSRTVSGCQSNAQPIAPPTLVTA